MPATVPARLESILDMMLFSPALGPFSLLTAPALSFGTPPSPLPPVCLFSEYQIRNHTPHRCGHMKGDPGYANQIALPEDTLEQTQERNEKELGSDTTVNLRLQLLDLFKKQLSTVSCWVTPSFQWISFGPNLATVCFACHQDPSQIQQTTALSWGHDSKIHFLLPLPIVYFTSLKDH